ncbi:MAG TPA: methionine--tRNA ligase [Actinopolymorphaceae bacterium]|jgi:methionyl-tRNA synthetase
MSTRSDRFYVTTSIPYVNADPHLGHALELVQADVLARHRRLRGDEVRFQSGTDDNALKNVQAAQRAGLPVQEFVDIHAASFERLCRELDISHDDFIRTSRDPRHHSGAQRLWRACAESGDIYWRHYEGLYCVGCEQFYTPDELVDGRCPDHDTVPQLVSEENWFFRLSRYQDQLLELLDSKRLRIEPAVRANEVRAFIAGGLEDFSISRSVERTQGWGVPVPGDPTQVMYVWWDALGNYITSLDYGESGTDAEAFRTWWSGAAGSGESDRNTTTLGLDDGPGTSAGHRRIHVIGKGILRFHAVYWPAMLLSAGLPLPTHIYVHDYLTVDGRKLSKSLGNVVDPLALVGDYGADALRWWLIAKVPKVGDTDFTIDRLIDAANRDLAGGIGNLAQRVTSMVHRYRNGVVPKAPVHAHDTAQDADIELLHTRCAQLSERIDAALSGFDLRAAAAAITGVVNAANRCIERTTPWALAKAERAGDAEAGRRLDGVLETLVAALRVLSHELRPFVPTVAERLRRQCTEVAPGDTLPRPEGVFPRIEVGRKGEQELAGTPA